MIVILSGPQGIGKTRATFRLADIFQCERVVDEWDGISAIRPGTLVITTANNYAIPRGGVGFRVADEAGIASLLHLLERSGGSRAEIKARKVRIPYTHRYIPCMCGAIEKDDCQCIQAPFNAGQS
ncbi:MAG: hypothetical protein M0T84_05685 [Betaproteobacteria bacterium]|nr:hypothetical protein [Betaproteobacteria bacterium]